MLNTGQTRATVIIPSQGTNGSSSSALVGLYRKSLKVGKKIERKLLRPIRYIRRRFLRTPLEYLPNAPDWFRVYRYLERHPDTERMPGGWLYKGKLYPDYLTVGATGCAVARTAMKVCRGEGVDVGAGSWPLPGAIPIDTMRGPGAGRSISDLPEESLDYVFSSHCLEHIEEWQEALEEWVGKLKPGGVVFLYLPHPDCSIWHPGSPFVGRGHKWIPTPHLVKSALRETGCNIIQCDDGPDGMWSFYVCGKKNPNANGCKVLKVLLASRTSEFDPFPTPAA